MEYNLVATLIFWLLFLNIKQNSILYIMALVMYYTMYMLHIRSLCSELTFSNYNSNFEYFKVF